MEKQEGNRASQVTKRKQTSSGAVSDNGMTDGSNSVMKKSEGGFLQNLVDIDVEWTEKLAVCTTKESSYGQWRPLMRALEYSAHGVPWLIGNALAILVTHQLTLHQTLFNLFYGLLLDLVIVTILKGLVRRRRPAHNVMGDMLTVSVDLYSFPSGHSTRAIMVAYFFVVHFSGGPVLDTLMIIWGASVSFSRILLGRHHVLDVTVGVIIGILQYRLLVDHLWLSVDTCEWFIRPIQEELHL